MDRQEAAIRTDLAACYRIFAHLGWDESIYNHVTVKVPGTNDNFLINPYGLHYNEVTASNLVKVDINGNIIDDSNYPVNPAGMLIHSTIHSAREDAHCIGHIHSTAGMTVACQQEGLRIDNFYSVLLYQQVAYHDFYGLTVDETEKVKLLESLGDKSYLILRSHGLLTCGGSIAEMFIRMGSLQRSCEIQAAVDMSGKPVIPVSTDIGARTAELLALQMASTKTTPTGKLEFDVMRRQVDKVDASYADL